jgi:hypothetical protein
MISRRRALSSFADGLRRALCGVAVEHLAQIEGVLRGLQVEDRDEVAVAGLVGDQALALELVQGLAQRRSAYV